MHIKEGEMPDLVKGDHVFAPRKLFGFLFSPVTFFVKGENGLGATFRLLQVSRSISHFVTKIIFFVLAQRST